MADTTAWLIEDTRPLQPMYAAVNEHGEWWWEWSASNEFVLRFADKRSAEGVMRALAAFENIWPKWITLAKPEAREHCWPDEPLSPVETKEEL